MTDEQQQQLQWAVKGRHRIADMTGHLHGIPNRDDGEEPLILRRDCPFRKAWSYQLTRDSGGNYRLATVSPRAGARTEWRWFYDIDRLADFLTSQSMITTTIQGG
tara:strand:+ start:194 stop:508 length:315 start_codon:yes stop_codon:yes gene_type:complete